MKVLGKRSQNEHCEAKRQKQELTLSNELNSENLFKCN